MLRQSLTASSRALRSTANANRALQPAFTSRTYLARPFYGRREAFGIRTARWYSDEAPSKTADAPKTTPEEQIAAESQGKAEVPDASGEVQKQLDAKDAEARDWKDKYMRSVADFRNLQDRTARELKAGRDFAIQGFAKDLIESVDDFGRALSTVPEDKIGNKAEEHKDLINLYEGIKMTEQNLLKTLAKHGLVRFDPVGEKFNPNEHEALFQTPMQGKEENSVFHTQQTGFKLNGRIIRAAKVGVVKNA